MFPKYSIDEGGMRQAHQHGKCCDRFRGRGSKGRRWSFLQFPGSLPGDWDEYSGAGMREPQLLHCWLSVRQAQSFCPHLPLGHHKSSVLSHGVECVYVPVIMSVCFRDWYPTDESL
jgi:hypothetical protein